MTNAGKASVVGRFVSSFFLSILSLMGESSLSMACSLPPAFYGLPKNAVCLGEWSQDSSILRNDSVLRIYDTDGNLVHSVRTFRIYLNDFRRPAILQGVPDHYFGKSNPGSSVEFVLSIREASGVFSGNFINRGDIYRTTPQGSAVPPG